MEKYAGGNSYRLLVNSKFEGMYVAGTEEGGNNLLEINSSWKIGICTCLAVGLDVWEKR